MPRSPQELLAAVKGAVEPHQQDIVTPPPGRDVFVNVGSAVARTGRVGKPLHPRVVAWTWEGLGSWLLPHQWPWGQADDADEAEAAKESLLAARKKRDESGNFDGRGRRPEGFLELPDAGNFFDARPPREMPPRPFLPPGVVIKE